MVGAVNVTSIVVSCRTLYAIGGVLNGLSLSRFTSGVTLQDNGGDDLVVSASGSFRFSTPILDGDSFSIAITRQPTKPSETCTLANGAGTVKGSVVSSITVDCQSAPPQFAYAANTIGNISEYTVAATGALSLAGTYPTISSGPYSIAVDPSGQFVYVGNIRGGVEAYSIDQASGALAEITGSPFQDVHTPNAIAVDPTSKYVYVANNYGGPTNQGSVSVYTIDAATGALSEITNSPYTVNYNPGSIAVDSAGKFLYLAGSSGEVAFGIDSASGALTPLTGSPLPLGTIGVAISLNPVQPFAYSTYNSTGRVGLASYSVDTITGALSNIANLSYPAAVEIGPIAVDPTGKFVYVLTDLGGAPLVASIQAYSADASTGALTSLVGAPFVGPPGPHAMVVDRAGDFLFVTGGVAGSVNGAVTVYAIDKATGIISEVAGGPYPAGDFPAALAVY
jgi:6-phosphogluconolactonase (cycloisomerase 2 family)